MSEMRSTPWPQIAAVYLAAFLQGMALVSFPASSGVLREIYGLDDAQYGAIFLPQVALTVLGALAGGGLVRRLGLQRLLWLALLGNGASQLALALTHWLPTVAIYPAILAGTALLGLGFGLLGAPMNSYPQEYFPKRRDTAVVAVHTLVGVGLTAGPLLMTALSSAMAWVAYPLLMLAVSLLLTALAVTLRFPMVDAGSASAARTMQSQPAWRATAFWTFAAVAVLYAFAEGTFSNWAVVYLQEAKQFSAASAALALTAFWGTLVAGRLLISALVLRVQAETIWFGLPLLMAICFWLLPSAATPALGVGLFALAGLSCSAFFPLTIAIASRRFPREIAWVSSMLIAALMTGVGLGSFVVGALREMLPLEQLYRLSAFYPLAALALGGALLYRGGLRPAPQTAPQT